MAADEHALYVPIADIGEHPFATGDRRPGIHALDIATGAVLWSHSEENTCSQDSFECFAGFSAPISLSSGILFAGGLNGIFHAYSSSTGAKLWKFDTRREYRSVNQLTGKGGTIDGSGPVIAGDMPSLRGMSYWLFLSQRTRQVANLRRQIFCSAHSYFCNQRILQGVIVWPIPLTSIEDT